MILDPFYGGAGYNHGYYNGEGNGDGYHCHFDEADGGWAYREYGDGLEPYQEFDLWAGGGASEFDEGKGVFQVVLPMELILCNM